MYATSSIAIEVKEVKNHSCIRSKVHEIESLDGVIQAKFVYQVPNREGEKTSGEGVFIAMIKPESNMKEMAKIISLLLGDLVKHPDRV